MPKTPFESSSVRASASALCLLLVAAGTGFVPVAGLSPDAPAEPAVITPALITPIAEACEGPPGPQARRSASATQNGVTLAASLSHGQIVRGSDGRAYLHCNVGVTNDPRDARRQPVDLVLVLDTSGSMVSALPLLKQATQGIVERLKSEDHLTIVTYSNGGQVIYQGFPAAEALRPARVDPTSDLQPSPGRRCASRPAPIATLGRGDSHLQAAISGLIASGGTNISEGITVGLNALKSRSTREPLAPRASRRMLLMTDGLANQGITDAKGLAALVTRMRGEGVALSAVGLGSSYDEQLLGTLADAGGGAYHFVDRPQGLAAVYEAEVEALRALVARNAKLTIAPASGVVVEEVVSWTRTDSPKRTVVQLGDLAQGRSLKVVARLRLPTGSAAPVLHAVDVSLSFQDSATSEVVRCAPAGLNVGLTDDAQVAFESENDEIKSDLQQVEVARQLGQARADALAGRHEEAKRRVRQLKELTGKARFSFEAPSGEAREMDFDELADDMAEGESSERGRRAFKMGHAAARAAGQ